jgi:hypothetical protein
MASEEKKCEKIIKVKIKKHENNTKNELFVLHENKNLFILNTRIKTFGGFYGC